jgi:hypothetical protein
MSEQIQREVAQQPMPAERKPEPVAVDPTNATPVYGNAVPSRGVATPVRAAAYSRPACDPMHWLTLLVADRIDVAGSVLGDLLVPGRQGEVVRHFARQFRAHPAGTVAAILGRTALFALPFMLRRRRSR